MRQLQLPILSGRHPLESRVGQNSHTLGPHLLRGPVRQVVWENFAHVARFLVSLDNFHVGFLPPVPKSTGKFTSQESTAKDGDGFGLPGHSFKALEVLNLPEESDLVLDCSRDIVQLWKVLGFAPCGNEALVITNSGAILQIGQLGLGINPGDPLALEHTDSSFWRFHQLLNWGVECWQLKIQAPLPSVPLLEPELLHSCFVLIEPELLAERRPHVGQPVLITHYQNLSSWVLGLDCSVSCKAGSSSSNEKVGHMAGHCTFLSFCFIDNFWWEFLGVRSWSERRSRGGDSTHCASSSCSNLGSCDSFRFSFSLGSFFSLNFCNLSCKRFLSSLFSSGHCCSLFSSSLLCSNLFSSSLFSSSLFSGSLFCSSFFSSSSNIICFRLGFFSIRFFLNALWRSSCLCTFFNSYNSIFF